MTEQTRAHPRHLVDDLLTGPVRLSIVATLAHLDEMEFGALRDTIEVSDSVLSKQITLLEAAGYVEARKGHVGKRPRTWLKLTPEGRVALGRHLAALRAIVDGAITPATDDVAGNPSGGLEGLG
ncbi:transcriptional regulator [Glaciihabitans sp. dw_435]|uniref:winged helix-turn-helix domain-containing protein n=1 Tax=Glaciihabitans sp. dw_435 TaxID=2720081 RepID=UPI001BD46E11|nr:transcriptional regulator [Glaciihabitans sp. dw_435]